MSKKASTLNLGIEREVLLQVEDDNHILIQFRKTGTTIKESSEIVVKFTNNNAKIFAKELLSLIDGPDDPISGMWRAQEDF
ncbi:hypothetical protein [Candidatus Leptofilum sp.]|uniref:hypothetical protein n=1 Tax=Candidatus Leptofilum sp. TaxID=3241576 RepID=UPI003B5925C1